jgi:uncharacterized membrane protein
MSASEEGEMASQDPSGGETNLGVAPNVGGLLCYVPCCIGLVFSVVAAIVEKQSRFLRFHAFQSLLFHGVVLVVAVFLTILQVGLGFVSGVLAGLVWLLQMLVGLAFLGLAVFLMIKANGNEEYELPVIGSMARNWV